MWADPEVSAHLGREAFQAERTSCNYPGRMRIWRNTCMEASVAIVRPVRKEVRHGVMEAGSGTALWII